jgi:hypothetical protein
MLKKRSLATIAVALVISSISQIGVAQAATRPTLAQKLQLQYLVEEEKLARDVYAYLAANVTSMKFANIARSEQTHMDLIGGVLKTYKFYNPTLTRKAGVFRDASLQRMYNELIAKGQVGIVEAFQVGVDIENLDIKDLEEMLNDTMPADMKYALERLLAGSRNHLASFTN